ncbi:hypothetical protein [Blastopirellula marina]|uniref:YcxB-like protein domain-containing protein n=1 Tax=Blastopirellula marina TaxID=124 RepID=A0A2S8GJ95_9BACT|nr:hypothetical protein [Blastopirellula marina]PQO44523.1 hypothetical protein C5Y93_19135 [Blastopirellula marina]
MADQTENPFASPVDVSHQNHHAFHASEREAATQQNFQAVIAAILTVLIGILTIGSTALISTINTNGAMVTIGILVFMTVSCLATMLNHRFRAGRALQRLPLTIDEEGIQAKFEDGGAWNWRKIPWDQITNVRFVPRDRMVVTDISGQESIADLRLMAAGRWGPLRSTLRHYSDWMAEARG